MVTAVAEEATTDQSSSPPEAARVSAPPFALLVVLFVLSGGAGLIDQLCFSKYLTYVVGSTAYAVSAVLAAFMTGLAFGAYLGGKYCARVARPLFVYGLLELLVALVIALSPAAFDALTALYVALARAVPGSLPATTALRWLLALLLVVVPTTAMGATLPVLSRALGQGGSAAESGTPRRLGALYAANTLGGGLGALLSAYWLLSAFGLSGTLWLSAALSAIVGVLAIAYGQNHVVPPPAIDRDPGQAGARPAHESRATRREARLLALLAAASGAVVFAAEVVFTHLLALTIGNSAYAFGLILAVFLGCLCTGAAMAPRVHRRFGARALPFGLGLSAAALAVTLPVWDWLPVFFTNTGEYIQSFAGRETIRAVVTVLILILPATAMGLTFPLLLQRIAADPRLGERVGKLTTINTVAAVLGSLLVGYVLLPWLGSQTTLTGLVLVLALLSLLTARALVARLGPALACVLGAAGLVALLGPRWNAGRMTSGNNVYFDARDPDEKLVMLREDVHGGVTTVTEARGVLTLYTNGKFQGNNGWELTAQRFFAHYPCLFVRDFGRGLVIGLGTGTTLGTLAAYPWQKLTVVEISPSIVAAAGHYFDDINRGVLRDPRVTLHHEDGRNHVLTSSEHYDLISMELSSVWFAGAANLYTREFYELIRQRLTKAGVFQQWVQLHHIERRPFASILHTLRAVFPHVILFHGGGQGILLASSEPFRLVPEQLDALEARAGMRDVLPNARPLRSLTNDVLLLGQGLDRFIDAVAAEHDATRVDLVATDDNLYLEYATPRGNVLPWSARDELVADMRRYRALDEIDALSGN